MINNNDEVAALLRLEAAVRVREYIDDGEPSLPGWSKAQDDIENALSELEKIRGSKFDAKASYEAMKENNNVNQ